METKIFCGIVLAILISINGADLKSTEAVPCTGKDCKTCEPGFWGVHPKCEKCDCGNRADSCDVVTGKCYCNTKGSIGDRCNECDESKKTYKKDSTNSNCYYNIDTDANYIFKLADAKNANFSKINFKFAPEEKDKDANFRIACNEHCSQFDLDVIVKEQGKEDKVVLQNQKVVEKLPFVQNFSFSDYNFEVKDGKPSTEFNVHIYNIKTPIVFTVRVAPCLKTDSVLSFNEA